MRTLLAIIPDSLNNILKKGEVIVRYYNPGNLFDEVHLISSSPGEQIVDYEKLQKMAGRARVYVYFLPPPSFVKTLGWRKCFLSGWLQRGAELAKKIKPDVIRCYDNFAGGFLGSHLKRVIGVPMILSLHNSALLDRTFYRLARFKNAGFGRPVAMAKFLKGILVDRRSLPFEKEAISSADIVLPVYESLGLYARRMGGKSVTVCYNVINPDKLVRKNNYELHSPARIICVSNQQESKNPENIIRAMALLRDSGIDTDLYLVGDGPINGYLRVVAKKSAVSERVKFYRSINNGELCCDFLPNSDVFVAHTNYPEISKAVMEALMTGLPVIINKLEDKSLGFDVVPELSGGIVTVVENTPHGYFEALKKILADGWYRKKKGCDSYEKYFSRYAPGGCEEVYVNIYKKFLAI